MLADDLAVGRDQFPGRIGQRLALLCQVSVEKALVVTARDEADLLRIGLLGQCEAMLASQFPHLGLGHPAQREDGSAQLLLR